MGFDGKQLIHPGQIAACKRAYGATPEDLAWARRVLEEVDANPEGIGAIKVDGKMIEDLHVRRAADVVAREEAGDEGRDAEFGGEALGEVIVGGRGGAALGVDPAFAEERGWRFADHP